MHISTQSLSPFTSMQKSIVTVGKRYRHYSGKEYVILAIAHHSENPEMLMVVYQSLYDCPRFGNNAIWVRPYDMFIELVEINTIQQPRFALIEE